LYLAGALTYHYKNKQFDKATKWRNKLIAWCDDNYIKYYNPANTYSNECNHTYNSKLCVDQNRYYLNKADILIVDLNDILESPGTQWEIVYASEVRKIPIIAFGQANWSPHIMYGISHLCKNEDEVVEVLANMFLY
jgi:nucleoside 2-deoxyribosyltransferase